VSTKRRRKRREKQTKRGENFGRARARRIFNEILNQAVKMPQFFRQIFHDEYKPNNGKNHESKKFQHSNKNGKNFNSNHNAISSSKSQPNMEVNKDFHRKS
jgi:hypothetical protein